MAIFYPDYFDIIESKTDQPTEAEMALILELSKLPVDFNVYYKPHVSYAYPDFIIERRNSGTLLVGRSAGAGISESCWKFASQKCCLSDASGLSGMAEGNIR